MKYLIITLTSSFLFSSFSYAKTANVDESIFGDRVGCFIEINNQTGKTVGVYNPQRCKERLSPNSTFKLPLSFIAFEEKIFATPSTKIPWDGVKRRRVEWNEDQTPQSWITESTIWVSQVVTSKLGEATIKKYLKKLNYGNQDISGGLTRFWLDSSLKISADEQVQVLRSLWTEKVFSDETFKKEKEILFYKELPSGFKVYGKTGTGCLDGNACKKQQGWFVGVLEKGSESYSFALNFSDSKKRTEGYAGLEAKGMALKILEAQQ